MAIFKRPALFLVFGAFIVNASSAQMPYSGSTTRKADGQMTTTLFFKAESGFAKVIAGAPYFAEESSSQTQTLGDGTHIVQNQKLNKRWRDSAGRTRIERPAVRTRDESTNMPMIVEISDPVAGYSYIFDSQSRVAHRMPLRSTPPPKNDPNLPSTIIVKRLPPEQAQAQPQTESEDLGTQNIEGVLANGTRMTRTIPIGFAGNDKPIVTVNELWMSPDLHLSVLIKNSDPRTGEQITRLTNISRDEPDPSLFQPPPGYTVVDEKGEFTMTMVYNQ